MTCVSANVPASPSNSKKKRVPSYLAGVEAAVLNLGDHVALAGNVHAVGEGLVDSGLLAGHEARDVLHLLGADLCSSPVSAVFFFFP